MEATSRLKELEEQGKLRWRGEEHGWVARPEEIVDAPCRDGFEEYKCEITQGRRDRGPTGGMWQGLNLHTGAVASAIWVHPAAWPDALVFIDIDGERLQGG
jgi:hypothetical protein